MDKLKVFAPASVANVGPAFDVLGFALEGKGDVVIARKIAEPIVKISKISGDNGKLSMDAAKNTAGIAAKAVLKKINAKEGIEIELEKNLPLGSGLGSSASSAVCGAFAANLLFGKKLNEMELIECCLEAENFVSGWHADNVAPSLLGGFALIQSYEPLNIIKLPALEKAFVSIATPAFELPTKKAREVLPKQIELKTAVKQWGNVASLVAAIYKKDLKLFGKAIDDKIVETARAPLIPGFFEVKKSALNAGALGCSISGAGPSIFAVSDSKKTAENVSNAMAEAFEKHSLKNVSFVSKISKCGARKI